MTWWETILFPGSLAVETETSLPLLFFGGAAYLLIIFNWSYSDGDRVGYLQKLSRKGWICKTQEGELAMTTVPGVAPVLWSFSVWDDAVAKKLDGQMGKRVVLHYKEFRYIPTTCFGRPPTLWIGPGSLGSDGPILHAITATSFAGKNTTWPARLRP
ncbi:MAG: hypothetical protein IPO99_20445 [Nitrospira sp.]|nr:hypothetical protein [Nitrospira sp.]